MDFIEDIKNGAIFIYPTDTIYGLGCDATNKESVKLIKDLKYRDKDKPIRDTNINIKKEIRLWPILLWKGLVGGSIKSGRFAPQMDIKKHPAASKGWPKVSIHVEKISPIIPPANSCWTPNIRWV